MAGRELLLRGVMVHEVLLQNVIVHGLFTIEHIREVFRYSVEFMGRAGKLMNTVLCKE